MNTTAKLRKAFHKAALLGWFPVGLLLLAGLLLFFWWGKSAPTVVGTVNVDSEPLARGSISCVPVDHQGVLAEGRGPGGGATIKDGRYQIDKDLTAGRYQFEIQGTKKVLGRKMLDPYMSYRLIDEEVPVVHITLIKDVGTSSTTIDFDLKGIAGKRAKADK